MTKSNRSIIQFFKEKYDIHLTFDPFSLGNKVLDDLSANIGEKIIYRKNVGAQDIKIMKDTIDRYPDIPIFYNYLYSAYILGGKHEDAEKIVDDVLNKFPNYIFGATQKSMMLIKRSSYDRAWQLLGGEMDVKKKFPKEKYHFSEVKSYYLATFQLSIAEDNFENAKKALKILWELYPNQEELYQLANQYQALRFSKIKHFEHSYTNIEQNERTKLDVVEEAYDQDVFNLIYDQEYFDKPKELLVKYNHQYLCDELYKICVSIYLNFESIVDDEHITLSEAFKLLSTADYIDAFPLFITYLSQDKEFIEYFWEDKEEDIVLIAFNFGKHNPDLLLDSILKESFDDFTKALVFQALVQLVLHGYLSKERFKSVYSQWLETYLARLKNDGFVPTFALTLIIPRALDLNDRELLEKAKPFFDEHKIDTSYFGTYESHEKELKEWELQYAKKHYPKDWNDYLSGAYLVLNKTKPPSDEEKNIVNNLQNEPFDIFLFDSFTQLLSGRSTVGRKNADDKDDNYYSPKPLVNTNKTGRNDPCPCGSGKKFKKCCINSAIFK